MTSKTKEAESDPFLQNPRAQSLQKKNPSFAHNSPPCFGVLIACFARNAVFFLIFERWYSFFVGGDYLGIT